MSTRCPHCGYEGDSTHRSLTSAVLILLGCATWIFIGYKIFSGTVLDDGMSLYAFIASIFLFGIGMTLSRCPQCNHENIVRRTEK